MRPDVAVVVATHDRATLLPRLHAALTAQRGVSSYEIVIVDDASCDETGEALAALATDATVPTAVLRLPTNKGPAAARNVGWRHSAAGVIAFTDDDCAPTADWLAELVAALRVVDIAQGRTIPDPEQASLHGPFSRTLAVNHADGFFQTCNIAYRRTWLERVGGFDERFTHPAGEDTDLAWSAVDAGAATAFIPSALVHHDVRPSGFWTALRDTARWSGVVLAASKHPGLRDRFHRRLFWKPSHPPALLAATGIAAALLSRRAPKRRLVAAALAVPYLRYRLVTSPLAHTSPRRRAALVPATLVLDLAEVGVCVAASARYRTLVL